MKSKPKEDYIKIHYNKTAKNKKHRAKFESIKMGKIQSTSFHIKVSPTRLLMDFEQKPHRPEENEIINSKC